MNQVSSNLKIKKIYELFEIHYVGVAVFSRSWWTCILVLCFDVGFVFNTIP